MSEETTPIVYKTLREMPADRLAHRIITSLIEARGNLNMYAAIIERLIIEIRKEHGE